MIGAGMLTLPIAWSQTLLRSMLQRCIRVFCVGRLAMVERPPECPSTARTFTPGRAQWTRVDGRRHEVDVRDARWFARIAFLRSLTFEVRRDRRCCAWPAKRIMYQGASQAKCNAVGPRLDRGVRQRLSGAGRE
jgi:hypothetical protein